MRVKSPSMEGLGLGKNCYPTTAHGNHPPININPTQRNGTKLNARGLLSSVDWINGRPRPTRLQWRHVGNEGWTASPASPAIT